MSYFVAFVALWIGIGLGISFPDFDQRVDFLTHRSILTHGLILPLALFILASASGSRALRWLTIGVCVSLGVHLAFDLFPRAWMGFALVHIPAYGWTHPIFSQIWIGGSMFACLLMTLSLVRSAVGAVTAFVVFVLVFAQSVAVALQADDALWRPVIAVLVTTAVASVFANRGHRSERLSGSPI